MALACAFQGSTPQGASCAVSPNSVTANGVDPVPFAVNVTTTARSVAAPQGGGQRPPLQPGPWSRQVMLLLLGLMLLMLAAVATRRRDVPVERLIGHRRRPIGPSLLAVTMLFVLLWAACGGGGDTPPPQDRGTPAGTYNLTLTATAGGVSKTSSLTLKVN